jgi:LEA14-like dessication related protein
MQKRTLWILLALLVLVIGGIWLYRGLNRPAGTEGSLKPKLGIAAVRVTDLDAERIKLDVGVTLSNPFPIDLTTQRLDYRILIDSVEVIRTSYNRPIRIRSSDSTTVDIPMEVRGQVLGDILKRFKEQDIDSAQYRLEATIYADVPVAGERAFHFARSTRAPAFKMLDIKVENVRLGKLGLNESKVDAKIRLTNPNVFPIQIKNAQYTLAVGEDARAEGQLQEVVRLPPGQTVPIETSTTIRQGGKLALKFLFDRKGTPFRLDYRGELLTDSELLEDSRMALRVEGTLDELMPK